MPAVLVTWPADSPCRLHSQLQCETLFDGLRQNDLLTDLKESAAGVQFKQDTTDTPDVAWM